VQQFAEKRKKETEDKAHVEAEHTTKKQVDQEECSLDRSQKSPSLKMEEEEQPEQGGRDIRTPLFA